MGRRRISKNSESTPLLCRKFDWVLQNLFGNSITLMAGALGVPHASLGRVFNQDQLPSAEMIQGLAQLSMVNLNWLFGNDEAAEKIPQPANGFLPVSDRLLPAAPRTRPEVFSPLGLPTSSYYQLNDAYWFRVPADSPVVPRHNEKVSPGDFLLIEGATVWTGRVEAIIGRMVVLCHPDRTDPLLALVESDEDFFPEEDGPSYSVDTFGLFENAKLFVGIARAEAATEATKKGRSLPTGSFFNDDIVGVTLEKRTVYRRRSM